MSSLSPKMLTNSQQTMSTRVFFIACLTTLTTTVASIKPAQFLQCEVQDFKPSSTNPNFNAQTNGCDTYTSNPVLKQALGTKLDYNDLPIYDTAADVLSTTKAMFDEWFTSSGNSVSVTATVPLSKVDTNWQYNSLAFFPTSGQGNDNGIGVGSKNYFSMQCYSEFVYTGGESIVWRGNDDFWLYVNGHLLIDAGGIHEASKSDVTVQLDSMNTATTTVLTKGCRVTVQIFFAERCLQSGSNFRIQTEMEPVRFGEKVGRDCSALVPETGAVGDQGGGIVVTARNSTAAELDAAIQKKNKEDLEKIGIVLGSVFGFFALWFLILFVVWLCRREHIAEQRLMHKMGGAAVAGRSKEVEMGKKSNRSGGGGGGGGGGHGGHARNETYVGWSRMTDPNTGRTYYQNQMTGESRWADDLAPDNNLTNTVNPAHARSMTQEEKDLKFWGWEEHVDSATGVPFFHNAQTGETSWERPTKN